MEKVEKCSTWVDSNCRTFTKLRSPEVVVRVERVNDRRFSYYRTQRKVKEQRLDVERQSLEVKGQRLVREES
jgi:hypothetical protein